MQDFKLDFARLDWTPAAPGARHKAFERDGRRVRLVELTRAFVEADWCRKAHAGHVLEGELEIDFSGRKLRFAAGDGLFIPAGESSRHKARSMTPRVLLFLIEDA
jgi:Cupin domain